MSPHKQKKKINLQGSAKIISKKLVALFLASILALFQIPFSFASDQPTVDNSTPTPTPVVPVTKTPQPIQPIYHPVQPQPISLTTLVPESPITSPTVSPSSPITEPISTITDPNPGAPAPIVENPPSPAPPDPMLPKPLPNPPVIDPQVEAVKATVVSDLINSFGFSKETLDDLIKRGIIDIEVDLNNLTAKVMIDPSVKLPDGSSNLIDPLGSHKLPGEINYQLGIASGIAMGMPCMVGPDGTANCPPAPQPISYLTSGTFNIGSNYFVELNYLDNKPFPSDIGGDNRLHSVKIYDGNPRIVCIMWPCGTGNLIKDITYSYLDKPANVQAHITYYGSKRGDIFFPPAKGEVASRDVTLNLMGDNQHHIQTSIDYDQAGNVIAKNEFQYMFLITNNSMCVAGGTCPPSSIGVILSQITRTDANGNVLSKIQNIVPAPTIAMVGAPQGYQANVVFPDGVTVPVGFSNIEELLNQVLKIENDHSLIEQLRTQLLAKTDSETATAQKTLEDLKVKLDQATIDFDKKAEEIRSEMWNLWNQIADPLPILSNLAGQAGVSEETRKAILDYVNRMQNGYLAPNGLEQETENYINILRMFQIGSIEGQIQSTEKYLSDLKDYRDKVANAQTLDDLKTLSGNFPMLSPVVQPMIAIPLDPFEQARKYVEEGKALMEKVRAETEAYQRVVLLATNDLINSFGFPKDVADQAIKNGLIKIEVDLKNLTAKVTINPSVKLPDDTNSVYLADLLGNHKLPKEINYQLGSFVFEMGIACLEGQPCPRTTPTYYLVSGNFSIDTHSFALNYMEEGLIQIPEQPKGSDNRIHSVKVWEGPNCTGPICPAFATRLVKDIVFKYDDTSKVIRGVITYHDSSQGNVTSRDVILTKMEDGQYHIRTVVDIDKDGKVIAKSEFNYLVAIPDCAPMYPDGSNCKNLPPAVVTLNQIIRTDANGNVLSKIENIAPAPTIAMVGAEHAFQATIVLPDGSKHQIIFKTIEELIVQAMRIEKTYTEKESIRSQLLADIDGRIQDANKNLTDLKAKLDEAQKQLEKEIVDIQSSSKNLWTQIADPLPILQSLITKEGVSDQTKAALKDYVKRMQSYLDPTNPNGLEKLTESYIATYRIMKLARMNGETASWTQYVSDLGNYRKQVENAGTIDELNKLKANPPVRMPPIMPALAIPVDPREQARKYVEEGKVLLAKAQEEIRIWKFKQSKTTLAGPSMTTTGDFKLSWKSIPGATFYEIQESTNADFKTITRTFWSKDTSENVKLDKKETRFYRLRAWTAKPEDGGVSSQSSNILKIIYNGPLPPPPLPTPSIQSNVGIASTTPTASLSTGSSLRITNIFMTNPFLKRYLDQLRQKKKTS